MSLTISRSGISSTEITQYPVKDRFIKLPIEKYIAELVSISGKIVDGKREDETNAPQIALINAANDPRFRFIVAAYSRRLGKTYMANIIAQLILLMPGCNVLIMSPNYSLSTISFELQRKLASTFKIEVSRDNLKDRILELSNGSSIRMGSVGQVDSCLGRSYDFILFDEAAVDAGGKDAFNVALRPTMDKPNSKAIFISTPRGKLNWFSEFYDRGFSDDFPQWVSLHATYHENKRMSAADIAEAKLGMSQMEFEQEYEASFNSFEGRIYNFSSDDIFNQEFAPLDYVERFGGLDPGYKDPTAFVVLAFEPGVLNIDAEGNTTETLGIYHVIDEYLASNAVTSVHAAAMQELIDKWGVEIIFIDSAAAQFAADLAYDYNISTSKGIKDVLPGIASLQTIIEQSRLKVASHCKHTLAMLAQYRWDDRATISTEKPKHDEYSHMADALRYAIYTYTV